jgi:hypothetical protein
MNENLLNEIGEMAEEIDNVLFTKRNFIAPLPAHIHLQAMEAKLEEVRDDLARIYKQNSGGEELNLQAYFSERKQIDLMEKDNKHLRKTLKKIVEAGDLWGSEGKQHHEALYLA